MSMLSKKKKISAHKVVHLNLFTVFSLPDNEAMDYRTPGSPVHIMRAPC
jgi:hypothetical protein